MLPARLRQIVSGNPRSTAPSAPSCPTSFSTDDPAQSPQRCDRVLTATLRFSARRRRDTLSMLMPHIHRQNHLAPEFPRSPYRLRLQSSTCREQVRVKQRARPTPITHLRRRHRVVARHRIGVRTRCRQPRRRTRLIPRWPAQSPNHPDFFRLVFLSSHRPLSMLQFRVPSKFLAVRSIPSTFRVPPKRPIASASVRPSQSVFFRSFSLATSLANPPCSPG